MIKQSQHTQILKVLRGGKTLSLDQAINDLKCYRVSERVRELNDRIRHKKEVIKNIEPLGKKAIYKLFKL
jgi:hypothetical protein